jgi:hypothetical protein
LTMTPIGEKVISPEKTMRAPSQHKKYSQVFLDADQEQAMCLVLFSLFQHSNTSVPSLRCHLAQYFPQGRHATNAVSAFDLLCAARGDLYYEADDLSARAMRQAVVSLCHGDTDVPVCPVFNDHTSSKRCDSTCMALHYKCGKPDHGSKNSEEKTSVDASQSVTRACGIVLSHGSNQKPGYEVLDKRCKSLERVVWGTFKDVQDELENLFQDTPSIKPSKDASPLPAILSVLHTLRGHDEGLKGLCTTLRADCGLVAILPSLRDSILSDPFAVSDFAHHTCGVSDDSLSCTRHTCQQLFKAAQIVCHNIYKKPSSAEEGVFLAAKHVPKWKNDSEKTKIVDPGMSATKLIFLALQV